MNREWKRSVRVCSLESRRASEMAALLARHGAEGTVAPSMREIPLGENPAALEFLQALLAGRIDVMVFMTGVGARALLDVACTRYERETFLAALSPCRVLVRGPKPLAVLREWGTRIDHRVPEPNTWREIVRLLDDEQVPLAGRTVGVQEYGRPSEPLYVELRQRGAVVWPVPVYRWALPEDVGPLESVVRRTIAGDFDLLLFTTANQAVNVLAVAERLGVADDWRAAANRCVIASIGPTASETLTEEGLPPDLEPTHPHMGHLVREALAAAPGILERKQSGAAPP